MAEAERHFLEAEYDEYTSTNATGAAFCRSAALIVSTREIINYRVELYTNTKKIDKRFTCLCTWTNSYI